MAGYALGFDNGGAIPDEDASPYQDAPSNMPAPSPTDDNSGAAPVMAPADDNSGAAPVMAPQAQGAIPDDQQSRSGVDFNAAHVPGNIKRIVQYLMGDGSADPQTAEKFKQGVKTENPSIADDDANLVAVQKAYELGGPQAGWQMVQYNRRMYNAQQSFALAALVGVQGKPSDPAAAAQAATQASANVLDGSQAKFTATPDGNFTATVKMPGANAVQTYNLDRQQMQEYLNVGKAGQWDRVMETGGVPATLARITQGTSTARPQPVNSQGQPMPQRQAARQPTVRDATDADQPGIPGDHDENGHYIGPNKSPDLNYGDELEARSHAMFGQGLNTATEGDRQAWMNAQEEKDLERSNKVDVAKEQGAGRLAVARATGDWRNQVQQTRSGSDVQRQEIRTEGNKDVANIQASARAKADQGKANLALAKLAQQSSDANMRNRVAMARSEINNPNFLTQTDQQRAAILAKYGLGDMTGQSQPSPAAPSTPAAAQPTAPQQAPQQAPAANQRVRGQVYTTPKGQFRWLGNGWQVVQ